MPRRRFTIPVSIVLFLAFTLVGTYLVRKRILEQHMVSAMEMNDKETIRSLLEAWPCPVNAVGPYGLTPLFWAVEGRHCTDIALLAVARGADVNVTRTTPATPLHAAAYFGDRELVRALLDAGADVNARDAKGRTPLLHHTTDEEVIRLLISKGADVKAQGGPDGGTALHYVAPFASREAAELLLDHGADVNARDKDGRTPLFGVVAYSNGQQIRFLIRRGADVNAKDLKGRTPLHETAERCQKTEVALLIEEGAEVNAADNDGRTPLALVRAREPGISDTHMTPEAKEWVLRALRIRRQRVIELLLRHGAKE